MEFGVNIGDISGYNIKDLATHLYYKAKFKRGCVFKYSDVSFAARVEISVSTARKLRIKWVSLGWCRFHAGNLIFSSLNDKPDYRIKFKVLGTLKETIKQAYFTVFQNTYKQFDYLRRVSREITSPSDSKSFKWAMNRKRKLGKLPAQNDTFKISFKRLAVVFGCSQGKAHALIKEFGGKGLVDVIKSFTAWGDRGDVRGNYYRAEGIDGAFVSKKYACKVACNVYVF